MHEPRSGGPSRRSRKRRPFPRRTILGIEALEVRRLLHAGHEENPDPSVFDLLEGLPNPDPFPTAAALFPLTSIPQLSSLPGAPATVYLDFDGFFESTWGSYSNITTPVFSQDGDLTTFSDTELTAIQNIWAQVAEDYAPFRVNVTTVQPPSFANGVAVRVAIGGAGAWTGGNYGGIAYVNSFTNSLANTVYVFPNNLGSGYAKYVAEASSHESGHSFGLNHQSQYDASGNKLNEYNPGSGDGRAPIMGNSYSATRGLWWNGPSTVSSTTIQDDLSVISRAANGFGYRPDDYGDTAATATALSGSGSQLSASGIITTTSDVDFFSFDTGAGAVSLSVTVPANINNLDAKLELRDAAGNLITSAAPTNSFNATINTTLAAGSYRLVVGSQGNYDDVGQYTVSATVAPPAAPVQVLARKTFYNRSAFDGGSAAINAADDAAIASDKVAYRPGDGWAGATNVTSYVRGINGIMVDLAGSHGALSLNDFTFRMSAQGMAANNSPSTWSAAPTPTFAVRSGSGTGNSDRVEFAWADGAIKDRWLEVIVEGNDAKGGFNANTGLAASDVFFFGSIVGDTFLNSIAGAFGVDQLDEIAVRFNEGSTSSPTTVFDFNKDAVIDQLDEIAARFNQGFLASINIVSGDGDSDAGISSALSEPGGQTPDAPASLSSAAPAVNDTPRFPTLAQSSPALELAARDQAISLAAGEPVDLAVVDDELIERLARRA